MAVTMTLVSSAVIAPSLKLAVYDVVFDNSYPTGGEPLAAIASTFSKVFAILPGGNDTLADNGMVFQAILPAPTVAVSTTNVLMSVFWSADGTDGESLIEFTNGGDLSAVGQLSIVVIGK
jgi:hypothetical protein